MSWSEVKVDGVARIDRLAAIFEVRPTGTELPFAKFKIKVLERAGADFIGVPNVAVRNPVTGEPEFTSGLGDTVEGALADALKYFFRELKQHRPPTGLAESDFFWSAPEDF